MAIAEQHVVDHSAEFDDLIRRLDEGGVNLQEILVRSLDQSGETYFLHHSGSDREDKLIPVMRYTDMDWALLHPQDMEKLKGSWVALEEQGLVASGSSLGELMKEVRSKNLDYNPLVTFVRERNLPLYLATS